MNVTWLVEAVVRQSMVLISQLATHSGLRAPLAHVADQVFRDLVAELQSQGVRSKVIADMFGMALRTYHRRVRQLSEGSTDRGRSLWEAVLAYLRERDMVSRAELMQRFCRDDEAVLRAVLGDLVDSTFVFRAGRGDSTTYRAATSEELGVLAATHGLRDLAYLIWVLVHQEGPLTASQVSERARVPDDLALAALESLVGDGRVDVADGDEARTYSSEHCVIPLGATQGWEAALVDHFQTVVAAISAKLEAGRLQSLPSDAIGGSTYHLRVWPGHPCEESVLGLLARLRSELSALRADVNAVQAPDGTAPYDVHFYLGQYVSSSNGGDARSESEEDNS